MPRLGGRALSEEAASLWLAVLELLRRLQAETGADGSELLRAVDAGFAERQAAATACPAAARRKKTTVAQGEGSPTRNLLESQADSKGATADDAGWERWLAKLKDYKRARGDCEDPGLGKWAEDPGLGKWVDRQRKGKKALDRGEPSPGITAARVAQLEALDFAWHLSAAAVRKQKSKASRNDAGWEAKLAKLKAYKRRHGDCSVPQGWADDPPLGGWVTNQRKYKKVLDRGEPSQGMTADRVAKLEALGFAWNPYGVAWQAQLVKLTAYKAAHGHCAVPQRWVEDPRLGSPRSSFRLPHRCMLTHLPSRRSSAQRCGTLQSPCSTL